MANSYHPRGRVSLYPPSCDPRWPRAKRYGSVCGWPLEVRWWTARPPAGIEAVRLEPGLWIQLRIAPRDRPQWNVLNAPASETERDDAGAPGGQA